ncbi:MAG: hypothetical protein AABW54_04220 [Candidatus Micrarchaeota archaeon]
MPAMRLFKNEPLRQTPEELLREVRELAAKQRAEHEPKLTPRQELVLAAVRQELQKPPEEFNLTRVAAELELKREAVYAAVSQLKQRGLVGKIPRNQHWRKPALRTPEESAQLREEHAKVLEKALRRFKFKHDERFHGEVDEAAAYEFKRASELWDPNGKAKFGTYANACMNRGVKDAVVKAWIAEKETRQTVNYDERTRSAYAQDPDELERQVHDAVSHLIRLHDAGWLSEKHLKAFLMHEYAGATDAELGRAFSMTRVGGGQMARIARKRLEASRALHEAAD